MLGDIGGYNRITRVSILIINRRHNNKIYYFLSYNLKYGTPDKSYNQSIRSHNQFIFFVNSSTKLLKR